MRFAQTCWAWRLPRAQRGFGAGPCPHQPRGAAQPFALGVAAVTLAVALLLRRLRRNWPYMLIGLVVATALAWVLEPLAASGATPSASLRTVGQNSRALAAFRSAAHQLGAGGEPVGLAFALTIVALGRGNSIAKTVALRSGQRIDANREFRGQGLSNIVGGFFSSYVSCGSMNRSMPNLEAGARRAAGLGVFRAAVAGAGGPQRACWRRFPWPR